MYQHFTAGKLKKKQKKLRNIGKNIGQNKRDRVTAPILKKKKDEKQFTFYRP